MKKDNVLTTDKTNEFDEKINDNSKNVFNKSTDELKLNPKKIKRKKPILTEDEINKRKSNKKRFAFAAFVLLLGVGVMGNWYYENSDLSQTIEPLINTSDTKTLGEAEFVGGTTQPVTENEYFSSARVDRQTSRDGALDELQKVIDNADVDEKTKNQAEKDIARISANISIENKIETLVTAKGIDNCIAVVNDEGSRVDVIVDVENLDDKTIMQIKEISMEQLNCDFENVSIIQSKQ